jgi:hypothetical protein
MSEKNANWIPTEIVLLVDLVEEELVLLRSKFSLDVTTKLKCSRWEEFAGQNCPWPHNQIVAADQRKMEPVGSIELPSLAKLES